MNPFDKVTYDIEKGDITYTYGAMIVATYTDDAEAMAIISITGSDDVLRVKQSDLTALTETTE